MDWLSAFLGASIGKKLLMAVTGLCFCLFLIVHLAGNLTVYGGNAYFNAYVDHLHALGPLITAAELILALLALIHVITGLLLFYRNVSARPVRYAVNKSAGGRSLGSGTMPYTGVIILLFLVLHLTTFRFADHTHQSVYQILTASFGNPVYVLIYVVAVIVLGVHVSHGFWSLFQSLGLNHPKYMPWIRKAALAFSFLIAVGFATIPLYVAML